MTQVLRQSTQVIVVIGPFVDVTDGFTPETGITLGAADEAEILKADTATTTDISAATWAAITGCRGWYALTLTTSHTDTIGALTVMVQDDSVCLPVFARFQVIEEALYDAIYASGAAVVPANVTQWLGAAAATPTVAGVPEVDLTHVAGATTDVSALATNVAAILVDTGTTLDGRIPAALVGGRMDVNVGAISADAVAADNAEAFFDGTGYAGMGNVIPTVTTLTGHTPQTGDCFARLGAPAGASVSADIAAVKVDTAATLADTGTDGVVVAAASKTGYELSATGSAALTEGYRAVGATGTLPQILYEILGLLGEKAVGSTTLTVKKVDGATTAATYTLSDATSPTSITRAT